MKLKDYNKKLYPYKIRLMIISITTQRTQKIKNNNNRKLKICNNLLKNIKNNLVKSNNNLMKLKRNQRIKYKPNLMKLRDCNKIQHFYKIMLKIKNLK